MSPPIAPPEPAMPPAPSGLPHHIRRVSGTRVLLLMLIGVVLLTAGLYTVLTRLKLGGPEALKSHRAAAPATEPAR